METSKYVCWVIIRKGKKTMKKQAIKYEVLCRAKLAVGVCSAIISVGLASGCSQKDAAKEDTAVEESSTNGGGSVGSTSKVSSDKPADSTGAFANLKIEFGTVSDAATALNLAGEAANSIDVGGGVVITEGRINIKSIKVKANKERSDEEKALKKAFEADMEAAEAASEGDKKQVEELEASIEQKYEPLFEDAASKEDKLALRDQMKAELAEVELQKAAMEAIKEAKFEDLEAEKDGNLKWRGPFVYDLVNKTVDPALPTVDVLDGSYRRIEFKVKPARHLTETDSMINKSVFLAGTVAVGEVSTGFEIALKVEKEFRLSGLDSLVLDAAADNTMAIAFDPKAWLTGVDLASATVGADGIIHVDEANNIELLKVISLNIVKSTRFGKDEDHDGKLGSDEEKGDGEDGMAEEEKESDSQKKSQSQQKDSSGKK